MSFRHPQQQQNHSDHRGNSSSPPAAAMTLRTNSAASTSSSGSSFSASMGAFGRSASNNSAGNNNKFPLDLYSMLETVTPLNLDHIVGWHPSGASFVIHNKPQFESKVMPIFFQRLKYSSFKRLLHLHGFKSVSQRGKDKGTFFHTSFHRDRKELLNTIIKGEKKKLSASSLSPGTASTSSPKTDPMRNQDFSTIATSSSRVGSLDKKRPARATKSPPKADSSTGSGERSSTGHLSWSQERSFYVELAATKDMQTSALTSAMSRSNAATKGDQITEKVDQEQQGQPQQQRQQGQRQDHTIAKYEETLQQLLKESAKSESNSPQYRQEVYETLANQAASSSFSSQASTSGGEGISPSMPLPSNQPSTFPSTMLLVDSSLEQQRLLQAQVQAQQQQGQQEGQAHKTFQSLQQQQQGQQQQQPQTPKQEWSSIFAQDQPQHTGGGHKYQQEIDFLKQQLQLQQQLQQQDLEQGSGNQNRLIHDQDVHQMQMQQQLQQQQLQQQRPSVAQYIPSANGTAGSHNNNSTDNDVNANTNIHSIWDVMEPRPFAPNATISPRGTIALATTAPGLAPAPTPTHATLFAGNNDRLRPQRNSSSYDTKDNSSHDGRNHCLESELLKNWFSSSSGGDGGGGGNGSGGGTTGGI